LCFYICKPQRPSFVHWLNEQTPQESIWAKSHRRKKYWLPPFFFTCSVFVLLCYISLLALYTFIPFTFPLFSVLHLSFFFPYLPYFITY
jgi:hypothetical protein